MKQLGELTCGRSPSRACWPTSSAWRSPPWPSCSGSRSSRGRSCSPTPCTTPSPPCSATSTRTSTSRSGARPPSPARAGQRRRPQARSPSRSLATVRRVPGVAARRRVGHRLRPVRGPRRQGGQQRGAPNSGFSFDPDQQLSSLHLVAGHGAHRRRRRGDGPRHGAEVPLRGRATTCRILLRRPAADLHPHRHRASSAPPTTWPGPPSPPSTCRPRSTCSGCPGSFDTINVLAAPGRRQGDACSAPSPGVLPPGVEVVTGQTVANEQTNAINQALSVLLHRAAGLRLHLPVRRRLHHLQHLLDHRGPAHAGAGAAAHRGRQPAPGLPLGAGRGGHRRAWWRRWSASGLGVLAAIGLEALLKAFGITLPSGPLVFEARTVVVALVVGVGVTVVSAISPARRAVRIPPVAALADHSARATRSRRGGAIVIGSVIGRVGVVVLAPRADQPAIQLVGRRAPCGRLHRRRHAGARSWPGRWPSVIGTPAGPAARDGRAGWAGRTRCAAPAGPPRPPPP